jgi:hypothetical protein
MWGHISVMRRTPSIYLIYSNPAASRRSRSEFTLFGSHHSAGAEIAIEDRCAGIFLAHFQLAFASRC